MSAVLTGTGIPAGVPGAAVTIHRRPETCRERIAVSTTDGAAAVEALAARLGAGAYK